MSRFVVFGAGRWRTVDTALRKLNAANDLPISLLIEVWETTEASRERWAEQLFDDSE